MLAAVGPVLGVPERLPPYQDEQPFTRALSGVKIAAGVATVVIRARHQPRGYHGKTLQVVLPD